MWKKKRLSAYIDAAFFLHPRRSVMQIGEHDRHLVIDWHQLFLTLFHLLFKYGLVLWLEVCCHQLLLYADAGCIQTMHRFAQIFVTELDLDCSLRLENATPTNTDQWMNESIHQRINQSINQIFV